MSDTQIADKDKVRAQELHQKILIHAQLVAQNLWEMCSSLKEMRDSKYFYNLGYMNFDDYCREALGIKRSQAYQYISIANKLSGDFVQSTGQIGVEKLALLASISDDEREQVMEQTNVESVTVRELKEQIKGLQAEKQRLETDLSESSEVRETLEHSNLVLKHQNSEYVKKSEYEKQELALKNQQLAAELEDLKNNPLPEEQISHRSQKARQGHDGIPGTGGQRLARRTSETLGFAGAIRRFPQEAAGHHQGYGTPAQGSKGQTSGGHQHGE